VKPFRLFVGFLCATLAALAGMFMPFVFHGVRNLPWEAVFGLAFSVTWYLRALVGERLEGFLGGILWPLVVVACVWLAASRVCAAGRFAQLASLSLFIASLLVCVPFDTANSLATRIPLYLNESSARF
jgi:hypothetical protein